MPSHPERVRLNYVCPYCAENLMDGKHTSGTFTLLGGRNYFIGCPQHPRLPDITFVPSQKQIEFLEDNRPRKFWDGGRR